MLEGRAFLCESEPYICHFCLPYFQSHCSASTLINKHLFLAPPSECGYFKLKWLLMTG